MRALNITLRDVPSHARYDVCDSNVVRFNFSSLVFRRYDISGLRMVYYAWYSHKSFNNNNNKRIRIR